MCAWRPDISTAAGLLIVLTDSPVEARGRSVLGKLRDNCWYGPIAARTLIPLLIHNKSATRVSAQPHYGHARLPNQASAMGVLVRSSKRAQSTSREERCEVATAELFAREVPGPMRRASTHRRLGVGEKRIELTSHDDRRDE
jgi:hypothetical protein